MCKRTISRVIQHLHEACSALHDSASMQVTGLNRHGRQIQFRQVFLHVQAMPRWTDLMCALPLTETYLGIPRKSFQTCARSCGPSHENYQGPTGHLAVSGLWFRLLFAVLVQLLEALARAQLSRFDGPGVHGWLFKQPSQHCRSCVRTSAYTGLAASGSRI